MIAPADRWGPFADGLEPGERVARLRCLRAVVHLLCGPRGLTLQVSIRAAERGRTMGSLAAVLADLDRLAATDRRHVLASYAAIEHPREGRRPADTGRRAQDGRPEPTTGKGIR